jgi:ABC-2 type transport system permease protein
VALAPTLPLSFISGVYIPWVQLPRVLQHIAQAFPLQHLVAALGRGFLPGSHGLAWSDLAILAAWGAAGLIAALATFRWTPTATKA